MRIINIRTIRLQTLTLSRFRIVILTALIEINLDSSGSVLRFLSETLKETKFPHGIIQSFRGRCGSLSEWGAITFAEGSHPRRPRKRTRSQEAILRLIFTSSFSNRFLLWQGIY